MPFPRHLARFNRVVTNPIVRTVAGRIPPLAILEHTGRRSGHPYRTPIVVFPSRDGSDDLIIALTYGPGAEWVRNVLAAGNATLIYRGASISLTNPRLLESADPPADIPAPVRWVLRRGRVRFSLRLSRFERDLP